MHHTTDRIAHTTAFVTPVVEYWAEREIAQWVHPMKDRPDDPSHHERTLLPRSYISIRRPIAPWANALTTELHLAPPWRIDPMTHFTMSERSYHGATSRSTMKDRPDDPSHHEQTLLPRSYISLHHEGSTRWPISPWANAVTTELHLAPPWRIDPMTHLTMSERSYHGATSRSTMKDRPDDPFHHERTLLPRSYISLHHEGSTLWPISPWANAVTTELHLAPPWRIDPMTHLTMSERCYHGATSRSTMKDRPDDPSHHERTLLPRSYISLHHEGSTRWPISPWANALTTELHLAPPWRIDPMTHLTMSERCYHGATSRSTMKDRPDDPSHHERTLLPQSYISLHHEGSTRWPISPWANAVTTELHLAPSWRIDPMTHLTMSERSYHGATSCSTIKDRSDDPSHHERTLLPRSYISLHHEGSTRWPISPWANAVTTELHLAPPWRIDPMTHLTMSERSYHGATSRSTMKDRPDDPSHHERTLLPRSYISLHHEGSTRWPISPWANALTTELHLAPPWRIDPMTHLTMIERSYHGATSRSTMKDQPNDPSHHERTLLPRSYISLPLVIPQWATVALRTLGLFDEVGVCVNTEVLDVVVQVMYPRLHHWTRARDDGEVLVTSLAVAVTGCQATRVRDGVQAVRVDYLKPAWNGKNTLTFYMILYKQAKDGFFKKDERFLNPTYNKLKFTFFFF